MKGFYFSFDALLATTVLLGVVTMLHTYPQQNNTTADNANLDLIHTSSIQPANQWNNTIDSSENVITHIYRRYYSGQKTEAKKICENYFDTEETFGVYFVDSTDRDKVCGSYQPGNADNIISEQTIAPDVAVNGTFIGPKRAIMVIQD